jgi:ketosteroid isomerase-like protein
MDTLQLLADHAAITDALLRFANGMDTDDLQLISSAFAPDGVADFGPAAEKLGITFPLLEGNDTITQGLGGFASALDTSHTVSNVRIETIGDTATMYALVEAQHFPKGVKGRNILMKNRYDITAQRAGQQWVIARMTIDNIWSEGDISVVSG